MPAKKNKTKKAAAKNKGTRQRNNKHFAIVVGVNKCEHFAYDDLEGPINDVGDFVSWLISKEGGNLPPGNIFPKPAIRNKAMISRHDFFTACSDVKKQGKGERVGDRLYLYFAGHGAGPKESDMSLLPAEFSEDRMEAIPCRKVADEYWAEYGLFREVVLISDCCQELNEDIPTQGLGLQVSPNPAAKKRVKRCYGYGAAYGLQAREKEFGGRTSGVFTRALLNVLKLGTVEGPHLAEHVEKEVKRIQGSHTQKPNFEPKDRIRFGPGTAGTEVRIHLSAPDEPFEVLTGAPLEKIDVEVSVKGNVRTVYLSSGIYLFQNASGGKSLRQVETEPIDVEL